MEQSGVGFEAGQISWLVGVTVLPHVPRLVLLTCSVEPAVVPPLSLLLHAEAKHGTTTNAVTARTILCAATSFLMVGA